MIRNRKASAEVTLQPDYVSSENLASSRSTFSTEPLTTEVPPIVRFGPFGSGGTVVGFSKYEGVRAAFEENFARRLELGAQLVIYEKDEKVVDLYGYAPEEPNYDGESVQCVASSGKNMEAVAIAILVDRGLLRYSDLVKDHWPQFAANGKHNITIADVMRHAGGVPFVIDPKSKKTTRITTEDILAVHPMEHMISAAEKYPPHSNSSCYHAMTRGFIVNAILRRVDPSARSLSQFLRDEVTDPLSKIDHNEQLTFLCGIPQDKHPNYNFANWALPSILYAFFFLILPAILGFNKPLAAYLRCFIRKDGARAFWAVALPTTLFHNYVNTPEGKSIELSSATMLANARSIALINAATMAGDGSIHGVRLLTQQTVQESMDQIVTKYDDALDVRLAFTQGGYCSFRESLRDRHESGTSLFHPDDQAAYGNFRGWGGIGGSLSLVDREKNVSFAYCMNGYGMDALWGVRSRRILLELQKAMTE